MLECYDQNMMRRKMRSDLNPTKVGGGGLEWVEQYVGQNIMGYKLSLDISLTTGGGGDGIPLATFRF